MGNKLRNFLVTFVAALGLVVLMFSFNTDNVKAADYDSSDMVTSGAINNQDKDYSYSSDVGLTYTYDSSHLSPNKLQSGDTLTINLPDELVFKQNGTFDITNNDGVVIGTAVENPDKELKITFNDNVNNLDNVSGTINLDSNVRVDKNTSVGSHEVDFPTVNGNQTSTLNVRPSSSSDITKKGVLGTDANGNAIVTWTILVNRNELNLNTLTVNDIMSDPNLDVDWNSLVVREATWKNKDTGVYSKGSVVNNYTTSQNSDGSFSLNFDSPVGAQMYAISFESKLKDQSQASDGTVFKNKASMNATFTGNGGSGGELNGSASANVSGNSNSGNGSGNLLGSVILTKKDANNETTLLPEAKYSLYKKDSGSDTLLASDLTTDANGQISYDKLSAGDYYFVETTPPDGYQSNTNQVPFTITGQTTEAVDVTAMDEPVESKEGSILLEKVDSATGWRLPGAVFTVKNTDTNEIHTVTTDQLGFGYLYNLPYGNYELVETKAPDGYIANNHKVTFTIGNGDTTPAIISISNEKIDGNDGGEEDNDDTFNTFMIKYDADEKEKIGVPGAEYTLYTEDGKPLSVYTTNEYGVIQADNLKPGTYYFLETKAPEGYELNPDKLYFTITDKDVSFHEEDDLVTSDPKKTTGGGSGGGTEEPGSEKPDPEEPNTEEPGTDVDGNEDNGGGIIVDPENPGSNNNSSDGGIITNPINPGNSNNGLSTGNKNSSTLPQTGEKSGIIASLLGLIVLFGTLYFKRRNA